MPGLRIGDLAPDLTLPDHAGRPVWLGDCWARGPVVLLFIRHLGWPCAREHVVDVQESYARLKQAGGEVLVVTMGNPEQTAVFRTKLNLQFALLADAQREAYRAYGLERGAPSQVIGPSTWLPLLKATFRAGAGKPVGDVRQMPGAFVIDRQGIVRYAYYPRHPTDRPSSDELLAVLSTLG